MNCAPGFAHLKSILVARRQDIVPHGVPEHYLGVWQRSLLETAEGRDSESTVYWLQTRHWHADLRIPAHRPDFSGMTCLADCDDKRLRWLAGQQGFCGITQVDDEYCTWHRQMDLRPANGSRDIGRMVFDGERVIETGVEADYREIWQRLPRSRGGTAALELVMENNELPSRPTWLLVAGDCFIYVCGRSQRLPGVPGGASLIARSQPTREQLLDMLDVEISFGYRYGPAPWRIEHSTLPFREWLSPHPTLCDPAPWPSTGGRGRQRAALDDPGLEPGRRAVSLSPGCQDGLASQARHPPNSVMSCAPAMPMGSQMKPHTRDPSASSSVPMPSGAGMPATKEPNRLAGISQTSQAMAAPPACTLTRPGRLPSGRA